MRTFRIEVSDSIYEHILFFLQSLPKNLIHISHEKELKEENSDSMRNQMKNLFSSHNIKAFQEIKDPVAWQKSMRDEWE